MLSLGSVLRGAIPLLLCQNQGGSLAMTADAASVKIPLGAEIIRATRAYCNLVDSDTRQVGPQSRRGHPLAAELRRDRLQFPRARRVGKHRSALKYPAHAVCRCLPVFQDDGRHTACAGYMVFHPVNGYSQRPTAIKWVNVEM